MRGQFSKMKYLICTMLLLFSMTSCNRLEDKGTHSYNRTVLVYIAAENTLASFFRSDINEMMQAVDDIPENSRLIIYLDDTQMPRLISIERDQEGNPTQKTLHQYTTDLDSGDPETLHQAMTWVTKHYPACSYGLVLWSHGDGWVVANTDTPPVQRSICIDNNQNTSYSDNGSKMDIAEIVEVLDAFPRLEFILFDACFMQSVEVAYELRHNAKSIVASPAEIPAPGAPYHRIVKPMFANPFDATKIADEYFKAYNDDDRESALQDYGVLLSVIDCDLLEDLASVTAEMIIKYADKENTLEMNDIQRYCPRPTKSRPNFYDMNAYMTRLITDEADYLRWRKALDSAIPYAASTPWWYSIYSNQGREMVDLDVYSGISCYVPQSEDSYTELNALFRTTSWYTAAGWQQVGW